MNGYAGHDTHGWKVKFAEFTLREISKITELTPTHLMVWRNRGHLAGSRETPGIFTSRDAAEILVRERLRYANVPLGQSGDLGERGAMAVLWYAVANHEGVCEFWGTEHDTVRVQAEFVRGTDLASALLGFEEAAPGYLWRAGKEDFTFQHEPYRLLDLKKNDSHYFIDLEVLASVMVQLAGRSLFSVDISPECAGAIVRRLSRISLP